MEIMLAIVGFVISLTTSSPSSSHRYSISYEINWMAASAAVLPLPGFAPQGTNPDWYESIQLPVRPTGPGSPSPQNVRCHAAFVQ